MVLKVVQGARNAVASKVGGSGDDDRTFMRDATGHQTGSGAEGPHAHGEVEAVLDQVDVAVTEAEIELQCGMSHGEPQERWRDA